MAVDEAPRVVAAKLRIRERSGPGLGAPHAAPGGHPPAEPVRERARSDPIGLMEVRIG